MAPWSHGLLLELLLVLLLVLLVLLLLLLLYVFYHVQIGRGEAPPLRSSGGANVWQAIDYLRPDDICCMLAGVFLWRLRTLPEAARSRHLPAGVRRPPRQRGARIQPALGRPEPTLSGRDEVALRHTRVLRSQRRHFAQDEVVPNGECGLLAPRL